MAQLKRIKMNSMKVFQKYPLSGISVKKTSCAVSHTDNHH